MIKPDVLSLSGGIDRSKFSSKATDGFYDLLGLRQSQVSTGVLESAPYFYTASTYSPTTTATGTEPSTTPVIGVITFQESVANIDYYITSYAVRNFAGTVIPVYEFQAFPAKVDGDLTKECRLQINNQTGLGVAYAGTIDVVIDSATTFKWRKNGGAYTTLVPIAVGGVSIDSGNATVHFLTDTGFTITDTWTWQRTDTVQVDATTRIRQPSFVQYGNEVFFTGPSNAVYSLYKATSGYVVVRAGYRPFFAGFLHIYTDHLLAAPYTDSASGASLLFNAYPYNLTLAWSDKFDVHAFLPTDVNEADTKLFPASGDFAAQGNAMHGLLVLNQMAYCVTAAGIYGTPDLGLPDVFNWQLVQEFPSSTNQNNSAPPCLGVVQGRNVGFLFTEQGLWTFNTNGIRLLSSGLRPFFTSANAPVAIAVDTRIQLVYNSMTFEVHLMVGTALYTYQELTQTFYRRELDFTSTTQPYCLGIRSGALVVGCGTLTVRREDLAFVQSPDKNNTTGTLYTTPTVTFHALGGPNAYFAKECEGAFLSASVATAGGTAYSTASNCQFRLAWYRSVTGIPVTRETATSAVWVNTRPDGMISFPRVSFRYINFQIELVGLVSNKPPAIATIANFEPVIINNNASR